LAVEADEAIELASNALPGADAASLSARSLSPEGDYSSVDVDGDRGKARISGRPDNGRWEVSLLTSMKRRGSVMHRFLVERE